MIAYFALLSFVPLLFLALALLGLFGRADESSYLVTELKRALPGSSVSSIVDVIRTIQRNAATLGIIGGAALLWTSLSLFSVLGSAFNIVYGRPNRPFLRGKALAVGTLALESTFQILPVYLRLSNHVPALEAFGGPAILLVWLYVMANVIVFGAEVNYWWSRDGRR